MAARPLRWFLVVAFSVALAHAVWQIFGPPVSPDYRIGGRVTAMSSPNTDAKHLYLRRNVYLKERPRHAWLQVVGCDRLALYVNGTLLAQERRAEETVAMMADLAPYLTLGPNVIGIAAEQSTLPNRPMVAVEGAYTQGQNELSLSSGEQWRCAEVFELQADYWFSVEFDDRHWATPNLAEKHLQGFVSTPPRATSVASRGRWIAPADPVFRRASIRREFVVAARPRRAWLRLTANSPYRLALNGTVVDVQEQELGTTVAVKPVQRSYDITPFVHQGRNVLALAMASNGNPPRLAADFEVEDRSGRRYYLATDEQWIGTAGEPLEWLRPTLARPADWHPAAVEDGDMGVPPWNPARKFVTLSLPPHESLRRGGLQVALTVLVLGITVLCCRGAVGLLSALQRKADRAVVPVNVVYLALVPATVAIAAGVLATYDARVARQDVYRELWLFLAALSVPVQWILLLLTVRGRPAAVRKREPLARRVLTLGAVDALIVVLIVLGFWLRLRNIAVEPLHPDEVHVYNGTQGFFERGFPSILAHESVPVSYSSTSELVVLGPALAELFFDEDCYVVRFPALCWGTATILLIFLVARRMFGTVVALVAAAIYTVSPSCIEMANFGRYFSQLQFMTILTLYFFYRTIEGHGPINHKALWLTAVSFVAMFLSWEASGMVAVGMMLAALLHRRGHLRTILCNRAVWTAILLVGLAVVGQQTHRTLQQTQRLWYGMGISDTTLTAMWRYPGCEPFYYIWQASWSCDSLIPVLGLLGACLLCVRHPFRDPTRLLLIVFFVTCTAMVLLLPVRTWRYIYHLTPIPVILTSAAVVAGAHQLARLAGRVRVPSYWRYYAQAVAALVVISTAALGSGATVELAEMKHFRVYNLEPDELAFPDIRGAVAYLRKHRQEGDVLLAHLPHAVDHYLGDKSDYWPQTTLALQAALDDIESIPRQHYVGTAMLQDLETVQDIFARNQRIWYVLGPNVHAGSNTPEVCAFLRENMEVVYEDFAATVMFRGDNHRSAARRLEEAEEIKRARAQTHLP